MTNRCDSQNTVLFNLWVDCPNNCDFCFVKFREHSNKLLKIDQTIDIINQPSFDQYDVVGLIGGELFGQQPPDVADRFIDLIDLLIDKVINHKIKRVQLSTAMLYHDCSLLYRTIDRFVGSGTLSNLLLCTSYDVKYRFKNQAAIDLWTDNFDSINRKYPSIRTHVEIICTNALLKAFEQGQFNVDRFIDRFKTEVSFLEPRAFDVNITKQQVIDRMPDFIPERDRFIRFASSILKSNYQSGPLSRDNLMSCNLFTDTFYVLDKDDNYFVIRGIHNRPSNLFKVDNDKGRTFAKLGYCDSDIAIYDDLTVLKQLIQ